MCLLRRVITRVFLKLYQLHYRWFCQPTRYDVRFRSLDFPVRVHPTFWIPHVAVAAAAASADLYRGDPWWPLVIPLCFVCTAGSILAHELGHALAGRRFGSCAEIVLNGVGGFAHLTYYGYILNMGYRPSRRARVLILLAGPTVNLVIAIPALTVWVLMGPSPTEIHREIVSHLDGNPVPPDVSWMPGLVALALACINLVGFANLTPIPTYDGWWIAREVIGWLRTRGRPSWDTDDPEWWSRV
jgi:stage IV sporulation protein FB